MNYRLIIFKTPADVAVTHESPTAFAEALASFQTELDETLATEEGAAARLRQFCPDGLALVANVKLGAAFAPMILVVPDSTVRIRETDQVIPSVAVVMAVPQGPYDQKLIQKHKHLHRAFWKTPVVQPNAFDRTHAPVEIRTTDTEVPIFASAAIGVDHHGKLVLHVKVDEVGHEFSIQFRDADVYMAADGSFRYPLAK
jgi:hypothetical protein